MSSTKYIDPVYHSTSRTEFHIDSDNNVLFPDFRLLNVGVTSNNADVLIKTMGVLAIFKQVTLYSNNEILDQMRECGKWLNFSALSNDTESYQNRTPKLYMDFQVCGWVVP